MFCLFYNFDLVFISFLIFSYFGCIFGVEYEFSFKGVGVNDDVLCVVCMIVYVVFFIMIFVKVFCLQYWIKEYDGCLIFGVYY